MQAVVPPIIQYSTMQPVCARYKQLQLGQFVTRIYITNFLGYCLIGMEPQQSGEMTLPLCLILPRKIMEELALGQDAKQPKEGLLDRLRNQARWGS